MVNEQAEVDLIPFLRALGHAVIHYKITRTNGIMADVDFFLSCGQCM